jgi:hypothetical protein
VWAVLPDPEEALPPVESKFTAIWRNTPLFQIFKNSASFPLFFGLFLTVDFKESQNLSHSSTV